MEVKTSAKHLRLSPTKTRLVIDNIRGKKASEAIDILTLAQQRPAKYVLKILKSGIANAINNFSIKEDSLIIKSVVANEGPVLKRMFPRAHGRADVLRKPMTHISMMLEGEVDKKAKTAKASLARHDSTRRTKDESKRAKTDKDDVVKATNVKGEAKKVKEMAKSNQVDAKAKSGKKKFNFQRKAGDR